jgi:hypothetical protein
MSRLYIGILFFRKGCRFILVPSASLRKIFSKQLCEKSQIIDLKHSVSPLKDIYRNAKGRVRIVG